MAEERLHDVTHWDGCWLDHHDCAIERIRSLEDELDQSNEVLTQANQALTQSNERWTELDETTKQLREAADFMDLEKGAVAAVTYEVTLPAIRAILSIWPDDRELEDRAKLERWANWIEEAYKP